MSSDLVWVPHPGAAWLPGKCKGGQVFETELGDVVVEKPQDLEGLGGDQVLDGVNDCCVLANVTPGAILHTVRKRYGEHNIYTNVANVLIALNPFRPLDIYSTEYLELYRRTVDPSAEKPHIFALCAQAFSGLTGGARNQSVLISGESGAGKTETTKLVLYYTSAVLAGQDGGLEDLLMEINPVLEAFGNAKTIRNNNSSRFGKWIEVQVNPGTRNLLGVTVIDYLLEVTRVCGQGPNERNYHIFYQLAKDEDMCKGLRLGDAASATYLKANSLDADGVDDQVDFHNMRKALATLNFDGEDEASIFAIVGAILHIGNVDFDPASDEARVVTPDALKNAAELLKVEEASLSKAMCFKRVATGKDVVMSPLDAHKARGARDSVAKLLYGRLFTWLVKKCNQALGEGLSSGGDTTVALFLGVLDIAGFESFETNMFEQLLINLSNEKLQQFFNNTVFKSELAEYATEGIPITSINFADNADVLELIEKTGDGLLAILDDCTNGVRQTDASFTEKVCIAKAGHARFIKPKFSGKSMFGVRHYAGEVWYTTEGFLEKNVSSIPPEVLELMRTSEHEVLQEMGKEEEVKTGGAGKKKPTVGLMFKRSLQQLMDKLNTSNCNFVRCIKPNKDKVPNKFDSLMVADQLRLCGVMETVKIRKSGFATRQLYRDFASRFLPILSPEQRKVVLEEAGCRKDWYLTPEADAKKVSQAIIDTLKPAEDQCAMGSTKVFFKAEFSKKVEECRQDALKPRVVRIQASYRGHTVQKHMKEVLGIHRRLMELMQEAGHELRSQEFKPKAMRSPTEMQQGLNAFDTLLFMAQESPVRICYLHEAAKVRTHIAAEVECAEQVFALQDSLNVIEIEASVAQAANFKLMGPEVDALKARVEVLKKEMEVRRLLHNAVALDSAEDCAKALEEVELADLAVPEEWLLADGADALREVKDKLAHFEEEKRRAEEEERKVQWEMKEQLASNDLKKMQEVLELAQEEGIDNMDASELRERCATMKVQVELDKELQHCMAEDEEHALAAVLERVESAGLDEARWLLPLGHAHVLAAKARLDELRSGQAFTIKDPELRHEVQKMLAQSLDIAAMQAVIAREDGQITAPMISKLKARVEKLQVQMAVRRKLLNCAVQEDSEDITPALEEARSLGLGLSADNWLMPDGPKIFRAAEARAESIRDIAACKEQIANAAKVYDFDGLTQAFVEAGVLGIAQSEYIAAEKIHTRMQNLHHVRGYLEQEDVKVDIDAYTNLKRQLDRLTGIRTSVALCDSAEMIGAQMKALLRSSDISAMQAMLVRAERADIKSETVEALRSRLDALQQQGPHHRALKNAAFMDDPADVRQVLDAAREAGLDRPEVWIRKDGMEVYMAAVAQLECLQRRAQEDEAIPEMCRSLQDSVDLGSMKAALDRAGARKVGGADVERLQARVDTLEMQLQMLRRLRNCLVFDQATEVERCVKAAETHGLDKPDKWLLPDGPSAVQAAQKHLETILAADSMEDRVKAEIVGKLEELRESADLLEIQQMLARAHANGVRGVVVSEMEKRVKTLKEQMALIRDLKNCLVFEESVDIQVTLDKVRGEGLSTQDGWLLEQGPQLYSRALARMIFCDKCEAIISEINAAASLCDCEGLEGLLIRAQDIGVPERKYADADALFVQLQNAEYVIGLLEQMLAEASPDPEDFKRMTNLVRQLEYLGVQSEVSDLKVASQRMVAGRSSAVWASRNDGEVMFARMVFEDFRNYSKLRDPNDWCGGHQAGGANPLARAVAMMSYQPERITEPLSQLPTAEAEKAALIVFEDIMRCMGDKPSLSSGSKELPILKAVGNSGLTDEVYLQVVKQLTNNPSASSTAAGWQLLKNMVQKAAPSRELMEFLHCWCQEFADPQAAAEHHKEMEVRKARSVGGRRKASSCMSRTTTFSSATADAKLWERTRRRTDAAMRVDQAMNRASNITEKTRKVAKEVLDIIEEFPMGQAVTTASAPKR